MAGSIAHPIIPIAFGPQAITNPDGTGQRIAICRFPYAGGIRIFHGVRTAVGAGTISWEYRIVGGNTMATQTTATAQAANGMSTLTMSTTVVAAGNVLECLIKGDGTLDLVDWAGQVDYIPGTTGALY